MLNYLLDSHTHVFGRLHSGWLGVDGWFIVRYGWGAMRTSEHARESTVSRQRSVSTQGWYSNVFA